MNEIGKYYGERQDAYFTDPDVIAAGPIGERSADGPIPVSRRFIEDNYPQGREYRHKRVYIAGGHSKEDAR